MAEKLYEELKSPSRILLGPGPSNIYPRVQQAMLQPVVGYLDPYILGILEDTASMLRAVFGTSNQLTLAISGTGTAGMDASFCNFVEPGDVVVVGVNGLFGDRMADAARRCGAEVVPVEAEWGRIIEPAAIEATLKKHKKVKLLSLVHAETSTGVLQPLEEASYLARQHDALFLVDAVTSLGGQKMAIDERGIDICYSCSQKCLGCLSGLSPFTAGERALAALQKRSRKVQSFYLDLSLISSYWTGSHAYHHTASCIMIYALHEALAVLMDEGLDKSFERHQRHGDALKAGLESMGLKLHAQEGHRLSMLTSVQVPEGIDDVRIRNRLLHEFGIEIGGGLGPLKSRIWRIGLMGGSSTAENVLLLLSALEKSLSREGFQTEPGAGVAAALKSLSGAEVRP